MEKTLIITRHGKRNTFDRSLDNGLNEKGRDQAQQIAQVFRSKFKKLVPVILSSPKVRCVETLEPTAELYEVSLVTDERLDESHRWKSAKEFQAQLDSFVTWWKEKAPHLTLICSHGDVIPELIFKLVGKSIDLRKGGWAEFELTADLNVRLTDIKEPPLN